MRVDDVAIKVSAAASDGQFWVSKVLNTIERLEKDSKYATRLTETNPEFQQKTRELTSRLGKVRVMSFHTSVLWDLQYLTSNHCLL